MKYPTPVELARRKMETAERPDDRRYWRGVLGGLTAAANRQERSGA